MTAFNKLSLLVFTAAIAIQSSAIEAADVTAPRKAPAATIDTWSYSITPYFWMPSLDGSATVKGRTTDVNVTFVDILRRTEIPKDLFGLMAYLEARNGRLALFADIVYLKVGLSGDMVRTRAIDDVNASVGVSAGLKIEMVVAQLAAAYEIASWGASAVPGSGSVLDLYAGGRAWWQRGEANLALGGTVNTGDLTLTADRTLAASGSVAWLDPLVGMRLRHQFAPGINLVMSGDVGGFGAGSKFSWQAVAALSYDFLVRNKTTWSGMIGYKALYADYSQGSGLSHYEYNMTMHGPVLGITARF